MHFCVHNTTKNTWLIKISVVKEHPTVKRMHFKHHLNEWFCCMKVEIFDKQYCWIAHALDLRIIVAGHIWFSPHIASTNTSQRNELLGGCCRPTWTTCGLQSSAPLSSRLVATVDVCASRWIIPGLTFLMPEQEGRQNVNFIWSGKQQNFWTAAEKLKLACTHFKPCCVNWTQKQLRGFYFSTVVLLE